MFTLKEFLDSTGFDWRGGTILIPDENKYNCSLAPFDHPMLTTPFELEYRKYKIGCPVFLAEDEKHLYVLCNRIELGTASFQRVEKAQLVIREISGMNGSITEDDTLEIMFNPSIKVISSEEAQSPFFLGWSKAFLFGMFPTEEAAVDWFMLQLVSGYMLVKDGEEIEGYYKILKRAFDLHNIKGRLFNSLIKGLKGLK